MGLFNIFGSSDRVRVRGKEGKIIRKEFLDNEHWITVETDDGQTITVKQYEVTGI
jgi:hypothetical protein